MKYTKKKDVVFFTVILYVLIAGGWWSYLLTIKNRDALDAKKVVLWYKMKADGMTDETAYLSSKQYLDLEKQYSNQALMIFCEGFVLLILTVLGIYRIAKSRQKEIQVANQQRNFLLSITHELKSPIASIQLVLETFKRRRLNEEQTSKLTQNALVDTYRLHKLVQDLLLAARVEGGYQYTFDLCDFKVLIQKCADNYANKFSGHFIVNTLTENYQTTRGDYSMLESVFNNIIDNALKYAGHSSEITIDIDNQEGFVIIRIADEGPGIPKLERKKVFSKFYRIGNEDTRKAKGTGLGLHIVNQIIIAHQGKIVIKDNVPNGTVFSIFLPQN